MARPKKVILTTEEKIAKITAEIETLTKELKAKKTELKELEKAKKAEDKEKIIVAVEESGKSLEEVLELLKK